MIWNAIPDISKTQLIVRFVSETRENGVITIALPVRLPLASGSLTGNAMVMTPFSLVSETNLTISCVLLISGIAFQIIALILAFVRRCQLIKRIMGASRVSGVEG